MSGKKSLQRRIHESFDRRREYVRAAFVQLCEKSPLVDIIGRDISWAIVGGAVRDSLLADDPYTRCFINLWPDVDVAVASSAFDLRERLHGIEDIELSVSRNSFGGWKVSCEEVGVLDIWKVKFGEENLRYRVNWRTYLDEVDFAINAVAFVWPDCEVLVHPDWFTSLKKKRVLRLASHSPKEHLQPIRAVALSVKLEATTGSKFNLSSKDLRDLERLAHGEDRTTISESLKYLEHKIASGRWPQAVVQRFWDECAKKGYGSVFTDVGREVFGKDFYEGRRRKSGKRSLKDRGLW